MLEELSVSVQVLGCTKLSTRVAHLRFHGKLSLFFATGIDVVAGTNYLTPNVVAQGKVNQEKFFGFKAGTLLCEGMTVDNVYNQAVVFGTRFSG